jgi:glycosyltransferase involved in cell wall biosynthesis
MPCADATRSDGRAPLASVVIPAYNAEAFICEALDSVLAQTFTDFEVVVVNDASTDGTAEILREYEGTGRVRVVTHEVNRGLSAARNSGIRNARGKYITFLDADDVWRPEKLAHQFSVLGQHPELMLLGSGELSFQDGTRFAFPPLPDKPDVRPVKWERLLCCSCGLSPSNAIARRECFDEVGGFDESLRAAEDRDMWLRIVDRFGGAVDNGVVSAWRLHGTNMSADPVRMKVNRERVLQKAFRDGHCSLSVRARAYANLYFDTAVTYDECRMRGRALCYMARSFLAWPFGLGRRGRPKPLFRWRWVVRCLVGGHRFERWCQARQAGSRAGLARRTANGD